MIGFVNIGTTGTWAAETWLLFPDLKGLLVRQSFWCLTTIFLSIVVVWQYGWYVLVFNWIKSGCWIKQDVIIIFAILIVQMKKNFNLLLSVLLFSVELERKIFDILLLLIFRVLLFLVCFIDNPGLKPLFLLVLFYDVFMSTVLVKYEFIC